MKERFIGKIGLNQKEREAWALEINEALILLCWQSKDGVVTR